MTSIYFPAKEFYFAFLLIPFLLISTFFANGQVTSEVNFTNFDQIKNFPNQEVFSVIRDKNGFLWIGTTGGLYRYDAAFNLKIYKANQPQIEGGLKSSTIRALYEDSKDNLWIGTTLGGLTKFHQSSGQWTTYMSNESDPYSISSNEILSILEDSKGRIWIGTENGLNLLDPEKERFTRFMPEKENLDALSAKAILSILEDDAHRIWLSTWAGGINLLVPPKDGKIEDSKFRRFFPSENVNTHNVWKIYQDKQKRFWLATIGGGLILMEVPEILKMNPLNKKGEPVFYTVNHDKKNPKSISTDNIFNMLEDKQGNFWVATQYGLNRAKVENLPKLINGKYNPADIENIPFEVFLSNPKDLSSIKSNHIYSIYEDTQKLLWFGLSSGISQYNWYNNQFKTKTIFNPIENSSKIEDIYTNKNGKIWIATNNKGLFLYDFDKERLSPIKTNNKNSLLASPNRHLYSKDDRTLFVGTHDGIEIIDLSTLDSKVITPPNWLKKILPDLVINSIYLDSKNDLWIAIEVGLLKIDLETQVFSYFITDIDDSTSISDNSVNSIVEDQFANLWIGTYNGLNKINLNQKGPIKFVRYNHENNNPNSLPSNQITALAMVDSNMLMSTRGGVYLYNLNNKKFSRINKDFINASIKSFECIECKTIWSSMQSGLASLNLENKQIKIYSNQDIGESGFTNAITRDENTGNLYVASSWGITKFNPKDLKENAQAPTVKITDFRTMNFDEEIKESSITNDPIVLKANNYYLSLNFAVQNYIDPIKNEYAYKLEGFDENWIYTNDISSTVYTNLDHGEYTFKVKGSNNDGIWNEEGAEVKIIKEPAYWETWLFQSLASLFSFLLLVFGFKYYTHNVRQRNLELKNYNDNLGIEIKERKRIEVELQERDKYLEHLVTKRTEQLESKNVEVNALLNKIKKRNDELEDIVEARTKKIRDFNEELKRSNNDLEQFAYIASHDLQAPLRTIKSFSGLLGKNLADKMSTTDKEFLGFIDSSIGNMQELIDALLAFSKVNSQTRKIQSVDPNKLLLTIQAELGAVLQEQNAVVQLSDFPEAIHADRIKLKQLLQNLISNGIKFSKKDTDPIVKISCEDKKDYWQIAVKDNGIGISDDYKDKIFLLFKRLHSAREYKGTGIGLALCKKIVEQHGGEIWVESEEGKGSSFIFTIDKTLN